MWLPDCCWKCTDDYDVADQKSDLALYCSDLQSDADMEPTENEKRQKRLVKILTCIQYMHVY